MNTVLRKRSVLVDPTTCHLPPCTYPVFVTVHANDMVEDTNLTLSFPAYEVSGLSREKTPF